MSTQLQQQPNPGEVLEQVIAHGNLQQLSPADRTAYYNRVCESLGLNPLTQPFAYITLNGKLVLYARRDATEQLRKLQNVSVKIVSREMHETLGLYVVTAQAANASGRVDESIGAVSIAQKKGEDLANCLMKAETKAKRRVTLSICGLGFLDETEVESIPDARPFDDAAPVCEAHARENCARCSPALLRAVPVDDAPAADVKPPTHVGGLAAKLLDETPAARVANIEPGKCPKCAQEMKQDEKGAFCPMGCVVIPHRAQVTSEHPHNPKPRLSADEAAAKANTTAQENLIAACVALATELRPIEPMPHLLNFASMMFKTGITQLNQLAINELQQLQANLQKRVNNERKRNGFVDGREKVKA